MEAIYSAKLNTIAEYVQFNPDITEEVYLNFASVRLMLERNEKVDKLLLSFKPSLQNPSFIKKTAKIMGYLKENLKV